MQQPRPVRRRSNAAFTLIELLTVIAIIGILAAIIIPTVSKVRQSAKNAQCVAQLREWGRVIQLYANDNKGNYYAKNWPSVKPADAPKGRNYHPYFSSTNADLEGYRMRYCPADPETAEILSRSNPQDGPRYVMVVGSINGNIATRPTEALDKPAAIPLSKANNPSQFMLMVDAVLANGTGASSTGFTINGSDNATMQANIQPLGNGDPLYRERHGGSKFNAVFGDGSIKRITYTATRPADPTAIQTMRTTWFQLY